MSDLISRRAAIDALEAIGQNYNLAKAYVVGVIEELPSAQPKRKTGRWIEDAESFYKAVNEKGGGVDENTPYFTDDIACSECLAKFSVIDNEAERFNFCPNCGADMRGGEDETD